MKKLLILATCCLLCFSCETESLVVQNQPQGNLVNNPTLTGKLRRVGQYPTAIDNMVDGTSCFAVQLPVTVVANGQTVVANGESGYQQIRDILAASANDTDLVSIQFPVTIVYPDYTQVAIATQAQFNAAVSGCFPSVELSCVGFAYPLEMRTYDSNNQLAETFSLSNKMALFAFLGQLANYDAAAFAYPLQLNDPDGTGMAIANNSQLEAAIDNYTDACLAALNPVPNPTPTFDMAIVQGSWYVSYFFDDTDETADYAVYDFTFNGNGTALVQPGNSGGTWDSFTDSGEPKVVFTFSNAALEELEEDWTVTEVTATQIKMMHQSGGNGGTDYLTLQKN